MTSIKEKIRQRLLGITVFLMVLALIGLAIAPNIVKQVDSGEAGVLYRSLGNGTATEKGSTIQEGLHFIFPWNKLYLYNVRIQERNSLIEVITKDGLTVKVEISIRFHPNINTLGLLHKYLGPEYVNNVILPEIAATTRDVIGVYDIDSLYSDQRVEIQRKISQMALSKINNLNTLNNNEPRPVGDFENGRIEKYILFENLFIKDIILPDAVKKSIESKIVSEQEYLRYQYLLASEVQEKERKLIEAQGIKMFEDSSRISILKWRGLQATEKLSVSPNSKIIVIGTDQNLPIILNGETNSK
jgi:regulator of protease activity HflC (stomatin/prohibitin superfamily)